MLSGRGLCDELITRPEESYRLWCVVVCDLETSRIGAPYIYIYIYIYIYMYIYIYDISSLRVNNNVSNLLLQLVFSTRFIVASIKAIVTIFILMRALFKWSHQLHALLSIRV